MTDQGARFRINWVADSTGIPEATLRAWERRYQVPKPARTPSGYRLYSSDDVAQVRKMRELCDAGISPADAAKEILLGREPTEAQGSARAQVEAAKLGSAARAQLAGAAADANVAAENAPQGEARLMEVVAPEHTNTAGVLALHRAVDLMERAATVAAARATRSSAIVVSCGSLDLLVPVASGQLVEAVARVVAGREGSISVDVVLATENVQNGKRDHVARSTFLLITLEPTAETSP